MLYLLVRVRYHTCCSAYARFSLPFVFPVYVLSSPTWCLGRSGFSILRACHRWLYGVPLRWRPSLQQQHREPCCGLRVLLAAGRCAVRRRHALRCAEHWRVSPPAVYSGRHPVAGIRGGAAATLSACLRSAAPFISPEKPLPIPFFPVLPTFSARRRGSPVTFRRFRGFAGSASHYSLLDALDGARLLRQNAAAGLVSRHRILFWLHHRVVHSALSSANSVVVLCSAAYVLLLRSACLPARAQKAAACPWRIPSCLLCGRCVVNAQHHAVSLL